jgi:16S rRNA C967 or C1407 C5-methylase (RsmB/RsmF family)/NOL1/NOP2/fmu family ribosome biogenesis protein
MTVLPPPFVRQMQALLHDDYPAFEAALREPTPVSVRLNRAKVGDGQVNWPNTMPIPWHPDGLYLPERPVFALDPGWHAGAYYVQEASSMFLYTALTQAVERTDERLRVLDLCAAPGGKSTLIAAWLGGQGLLVANEVIRTRVGVLRENLEKWGQTNVAVTNAEAEEFGIGLPDWFDVVVVDAPCSGEGLFRKDPDATKEWSEANVALCQGRQQRILAAAVQTLRPGGTLVYSTCTYNHLENGDNVAWMCQTLDMEPVVLQIPDTWGLTPVGSGYQFFPHRTRGEGFFIAVLRKKEDQSARNEMPVVFKSIKPVAKPVLPLLTSWVQYREQYRFFQTQTGTILALDARLEGDYLQLDKAVRSKWFGTAIGLFKGKDFIPEHSLAQSLLMSKNTPVIDLSPEDALSFLRKETFTPAAGAPSGWVLACHAGLALGWLKIMPNRANNYLPQERRLRMS